MFICRTKVLLPMLLALAGCAEQSMTRIDTRSAAAQKSVPAIPYSSASVDDLILFAGRFAELPVAARLAECRDLRQIYRHTPQLGARLHLLLARSVSDACGDVEDAISMIDDSLGEIKDPRLKAYLTYQKAVFNRLSQCQDRCRNLAKQVVQTRLSERKAAQRLRSRAAEVRRLRMQEQTVRKARADENGDELRALQQKLEALKDIEQTLEKPTDDK
jgi:exonuclease VII large subunit